MADQSWTSDLPTPNSAVMGTAPNTAAFRSPFSAVAQTIARDGTPWTQTLYFRNLTNAQRGVLLAYVTKLNGQENRALLPPFGVTQRGAFGGTCLVNGANQVGNSLVCDGVSNSITGWIKKGDYFTVNEELKMATADANSDGSGNITLVFAPRLRQSPSDGATVWTSGSNLIGRFMLANPQQQWALRPNSLSDIAIDFIEDLS